MFEGRKSFTFNYDYEMFELNSDTFEAETYVLSDQPDPIPDYFYKIAGIKRNSILMDDALRRATLNMK